MIISLSGLIGSGKDTIATIIQYLIHKKLVDEDLRKKTSIYYDYEAFRVTDYHIGWEVKKFAAKLKQIASILTGVPIEKFEDQEFKKQFMSDEWDVWLIESDSKYPHIWPVNVDIEWLARGRPYIRRKLTYREFLQLLGTNAIRDIIHPNTWVNALFSEYNPIGGLIDSRDYTTYPNWIITDTRFPNEAQAIVDRSGIMIKAVRNIKREHNFPKGYYHESETALDNHEFDYTIENLGTIEELIPKVEAMLKYFKIL